MYYKKVDYNSNKAMFDFLSNHFTYDKTIAHNVKVYNIPDLGWVALQALEEDEYRSINLAIEDWEADHPGYSVGFSGRSGGYLVLYNNNSRSHCFYNQMSSPCHFESNEYDYWKRCVQDEWGSLKAFKSELEFEVKLVQEFDQLCDDLVDLTKALIADMKDRQSRTHKYSATLRFQRYYYETLEDLKLHMLDMMRRGYSVWEWSDTDLYVEYEMNESINSEITLNEEGEEDSVC